MSETEVNTGTEIVRVFSSTDVATLDEFDQIILGMAAVPEVTTDADEISREIVMQLLAATSDAELAIGDAVGWQDLMGVPIDIKGFRWRKSDYDEGGAPVYVIVSGVRLDTGEYLPAITSGSYNVLAQLSNLARRGQLPGAVWQLTEAKKPTERGFTPLFLVKTADDVVAMHRAVNEGGNPLDDDDDAAADAPADDA